MPSQSILKGVQDLNICVKVAKKNNIDYKLFSVTKDEFTPFLTKRLEWEILNQGGRPSLSPQFKGNHRKFVLIHFLFPEWVPRFQLGTGTGCELWTFCIFSSLPAHPTKGAQNPTSATSVHQPPMAPTLLSCPCVPQEPQPLRVKEVIHVPHIHVSLQANLFLACSEKSAPENLQRNQQSLCPFLNPAHSKEVLLI